MSTQLNLLLEMLDQVPGRFEAFLTQVDLSPVEANTLRQGADSGAAADAAQAAAIILAEKVWAYLEDGNPLGGLSS